MNKDNKEAGTIKNNAETTDKADMDVQKDEIGEEKNEEINKLTAEEDGINEDSEESSKSSRNLESSARVEIINKTRPQRSKHTRGSHLDVWNRVAPKDVTAKCTICNKVVGISRFAVHLDKCMGIGNVRKSSIHS